MFTFVRILYTILITSEYQNGSGLGAQNHFRQFQSLDDYFIARKTSVYLTSGKELFQPAATDPVLVADSDRGEWDGILVVDRSGDVHRPAEELLG